MKRLICAILLAVFCLPLMAAAPTPQDSFWEPLSWTTSDGVQIAGLYHPATITGAYTWVLLHGLGSSKEEWDSFGRKLAGQGNGILVYDARGHYQSTKTTSGQDINYKSFTAQDWKKMPDDLAEAVKLLKTKYKLPSQYVGIGGASVGANIALVYASDHFGVPALLLLSAGGEYAGINIVEPWHRLHKTKVFAAASPGDAYAYQTLSFLTQQRPDLDLRVTEGPDSEHGVNMFKDKNFTEKTLEWVKGL